MNYLSIQEAISHEIIINKSRFICELFPMMTVEEFDIRLKELRKTHHKANHLCQAYILGDNSAIQKMSDDGEPSGTAGVPMLEVLKHHQLTNIGAIVIRYFGGIKLGAGGLVRAYSQSVSDTIQQATIVQNITQTLIHLTLDYSQIDSFQYLIQTTMLPLTIMDTIYTERVVFELAIPDDIVGKAHQLFIDRFNNQLHWDEIGERTINIPIQKNTSI